MKNELFSGVACLSLLVFAPHSALAEGPLNAPRNPFAADSTQAMPHGDSAQQDTTAVKGPMDRSRQLRDDELVYQHLGPGYIGGFTSSAYDDGSRVLWTNGVNGLYKLNAETLEIYDYIPSAAAGKWTRDHAEDSIAALDEDNSLKALPRAIEDAKALQDLSGIYVAVGANNWAYIANKDGSVTAFGDRTEGDPTSPIEIKGRFQMPPEAAGSTLGMNITYDGWIVLPTTDGWLVAVTQDLKDHRLIRLSNPTGESTEPQRVGYGWVRNSLALDDDGGIYIASRNHMHKVVWDGEQFSTDAADGAWVTQYPNDLGVGTGATPSLMGFGDEDQFVVITDGNALMNVLLFWRNEIPEDWQQLAGAPSRRIAGMVPASMGELNLEAVQTEQSVVVAGYGAFVVNNTPNNIPEGLPRNGHGLLAGALGSNPMHQPFGVQKMEWHPETREFAPAWTNTEVSSPNGVPSVSLGTNHVYFIGARDNKWTLEALDWDTGESTFHYVIGGQRFNSQYSTPIPDEFGGMMFGTTWGRARIAPKNQGAGVTATRSNEGSVIIAGTQTLSDSCLSIGGVSVGAPAGVTELTDAQPVTLEIRHSGDEMCAQVITEAPFKIEIHDLPDRPYIVLYRTYVGFPESLPEIDPRVRGEILQKQKSK